MPFARLDPRPSRRSFPATLVAALLAAGLALGGCVGLRQIAALRAVDFALDQIRDVRVAGVWLDGRTDPRDLRPDEILRIASAVRRGSVPLAFTVDVAATNPRESAVAARLVKMGWTLWLRDQPTLDGALDREVLLPPGERVEVPVPVALDLYRFVRDDADGLVELVTALAGGRAPAGLRLAVRPTITTPVGPLDVGEITLRPGERAERTASATP